ncbi:MAG: hypothetical protein UDQ15_00840 [Ruminococcus sp.]|nr:hypothetical protein [Ruminococcus sp.]
MKNTFILSQTERNVNMKKEEVFLRQHAIQVAIMCVEAMHADSTTLNPVQEADHFNIMQPLYRILGELDAEAHDFVDADLQALAKQVTDEEPELNLSQLDFLESDVVTSGKN